MNMTNAEQIVARAAAQWVGRQRSLRGILILFRDPVTKSTCALPENGLTLAGVLAKLKAKRCEFGAQA